jgi:hypothetical protein
MQSLILQRSRDSRRIRFAACVVLVGLLLLPPAVGACLVADEKPIWLAVVEPDLVAAVQPLAEHRRRDGFEVVVSTETIEKALAAVPRRPQFVLLVGDDELGERAAAHRLPAKRMPLYRWRSEQRRQFASDMAWGDLDSDGTPDVAVGRIPARTPVEVERVVGKIVAFEKQPPRPADLGLPVWLGASGYNTTLDALASGMAVSMLQSTGPAWASPWVVSGNPSDSFCGWPHAQAARFSERLKQGCLVSVLMGHANADAFFSMRFGQDWIWYTAAGAAKSLGEGSPAGPMFFFSCESGDFARSRPCQAESLLLMTGGPVAVVGATTESHPLTNYYSGTCLLAAIGKREKRLGSLWLNAQREAKRSSNPLMDSLLRNAEGRLDAEIDVAKLRRDQMLMYAILGDPATRLRLPEPLTATIERTSGGWRWQATKPAGAVGLEVGFRAAGSPPTSWEGPKAGEKKANAGADAANAWLSFARLPSPPDEGRWEGEVSRPGRLRLVAHDGKTLYVAVLKAE